LGRSVDGSEAESSGEPGRRALDIDSKRISGAASNDVESRRLQMSFQLLAVAGSALAFTVVSVLIARLVPDRYDELATRHMRGRSR
jgi:hypothetical protein